MEQSQGWAAGTREGAARTRAARSSTRRAGVEADGPNQARAGCLGRPCFWRELQVRGRSRDVSWFRFNAGTGHAADARLGMLGLHHEEPSRRVGRRGSSTANRAAGPSRADVAPPGAKHSPAALGEPRFRSGTRLGDDRSEDPECAEGRPPSQTPIDQRTASAPPATSRPRARRARVRVSQPNAHCDARNFITTDPCSVSHFAASYSERCR